MHVRRPALIVLAAALALVLAQAAVASEPRWTQAPSIEVNGSQLIGSNGGWLSESGDIQKYVFRFTRNGTTVKGPDSMSKTTAGSAPLPAGTYPDDSTANLYTLQAADAGQRMCLEVWGGIRSAYVLPDGSTAYDAWEWGHVNSSGAEAKTCITAPGTPTGGDGGPTPPTAPTPPAVPTPQAPLAPAVTAAPEVKGFAMVDEMLSATRGTWSGSPTLALEWQRCDARGENCEGTGLSTETYNVIPFDIGKTIRVKITASNLAGARTATSAVTEVISELKPTEEKTWIPAAKVTPPHRLLIEETSAKPARFAKRGPVTVAVRIVDDRGFDIQGVLVTAVVLPGAALLAPAEATTDEEGLASLVFTPGPKLNLKKKGTITIVVTARRPGDKLSSPRAAVERVKVTVSGTAKRFSGR
jgi:hypothetical protein